MRCSRRSAQYPVTLTAGRAEQADLDGLQGCTQHHRHTSTFLVQTRNGQTDEETSQSVTVRTCRRKGAPRTHTIKHQDDTDGEPKGKSLRHSQGCTRSHHGELIQFSRTRRFSCVLFRLQTTTISVFLAFPDVPNSIPWSGH